MSKIRELVACDEDLAALKAVLWCSVFGAEYVRTDGSAAACARLADRAVEDFEKELTK